MRNKKLVLGSVVAGVVLVAGLVVGIVAFNGKGNDEVATAPTEVTEVVEVTEEVGITDEDRAKFEKAYNEAKDAINALATEDEATKAVVADYLARLERVSVDEYPTASDAIMTVNFIKDGAPKAVETAVAKAEEERLAAEQAEAERLAAEEAARVEAERLAAEEAAKAEQTASSSSSKKNSSSKSNGSSSSSASNASSSSSSNNYDDNSSIDEDEYMRQELARQEEAKRLQEEAEEAKASGRDDGSWVAKPTYTEEEMQQATDDFMSY